jgi:ADP-ribosylglycohydrolase
MRISPIGLIHPGNPQAAVEDAIIACTPTHFTDVALAGACAVAAAVAQAMTPDTTLEDIIDVAIKASDTGLRRGATWFGASVARKIDFAIQLATDASLMEQDRLENLYDLIGATLAPADSVPCAFGVLAMANGNPVETAIFATALSGDADTVGAIACAIAGAWQGVDAIPLEYIETIRQANPQYDFEETAEALYEIARGNYYSAPRPVDENPSLSFLNEDNS